MPNVLPVILNPGSGAGHGGLAPETLREAFAAEGLDVQLHLLHEGVDLDALLDAALAGAPRCVVAAGGDGTINAVAARVADTPDTVLGVVPAGTLNHFAGDLGIESVENAARVIAEAQAREVDIGEVNGRVFLNNASVGLYARMVVQRERTQKHLGIGKWPALVHAAWRTLWRPEPFSAVLDIDGHVVRRRTPFIFVGNNAYTLSGAKAGKRDCLDDGALSIYVLKPCTTHGLLWLAVRALFGHVPGGEELDRFTAAEFSVESPRAQTRVARDGEVDMTETPVRFRIRPRALRVYAPRETGKA